MAACWGVGWWNRFRQCNRPADRRGRHAAFLGDLAQQCILELLPLLHAATGQKPVRAPVLLLTNEQDAPAVDQQAGNANARTVGHADCPVDPKPPVPRVDSGRSSRSVKVTAGSAVITS